MSEYHFIQFKEIVEELRTNSDKLSKECPKEGCEDIEAIRYDVGILEMIIKEMSKCH